MTKDDKSKKDFGIWVCVSQYGGQITHCVMPQGADPEQPILVSTYGKNLESDTKKYNRAECSSVHANRDICKCLLIPINIFF